MGYLGLTEEMGVLEGYLDKLSLVQKKVDATLPVQALVKDHNIILGRAKVVRERVERMFGEMKGQYKELLQ